MKDLVQHKPLSRTVSFWVVLVLPVVLAVVVGVVIYCHSQLGALCFDSSCVNYFVELYKVPLAMAGSALPLVAVVAAVQRSKEASLQIRVGQNQYAEAVSSNRFGNYLKHRDGFYKLVDIFCADKGSEYCGQIKIDSNVLYQRFFQSDKIDEINWWKGYGVEYWTDLSSSLVALSDCVEKSFHDYETLDVERFVELVYEVTSSLMLNYEPCRLVECEGEVYFVAKNLSNEPLAIYSTVREAVHFYDSVVSYACRSDDVAVSALSSPKFIGVIEANINRFKISACDTKIS